MNKPTPKQLAYLKKPRSEDRHDVRLPGHQPPGQRRDQAPAGPARLRARVSAFASCAACSATSPSAPATTPRSGPATCAATAQAPAGRTAPATTTRCSHDPRRQDRRAQALPHPDRPAGAAGAAHRRPRRRHRRPRRPRRPRLPRRAPRPQPGRTAGPDDGVRPAQRVCGIPAILATLRTADELVDALA